MDILFGLFLPCLQINYGYLGGIWNMRWISILDIHLKIIVPTGITSSCYFVQFVSDPSSVKSSDILEPFQTKEAVELIFAQQHDGTRARGRQNECLKDIKERGIHRSYSNESISMVSTN